MTKRILALALAIVLTALPALLCVLDRVAVKTKSSRKRRKEREFV